MKKFIYTLISPILFFPFYSQANETFSVEIEALSLVMEKYSLESDPTNDFIKEKPSYIAFKHDECNATVKITAKSGLQITTMESFDVNVCEKVVNKVMNNKT
tara:strand:- start:109 stop:414 length:306 start_codon:yes stop_codon:yes gene_type:complete